MTSGALREIKKKYSISTELTTDKDYLQEAYKCRYLVPHYKMFSSSPVETGLGI